jgi:hypothetical protein|nr:MAG TPA: hypothetical protein [Caudoviricetes sp.]DAP30405.1 MAG TPA: hypothetical protein [Caudoviricetes sp.]DAU72734.1 MAG TPA: hypothetical protein [Caudoviricetes sp.]
MFDKTPSLSEVAEEEALKYMLEEHLPGSPEYKAVLDDIKTLHSLNQKKRWIPSPDAVLSACASVSGILLILNYEQLHPVVSKAVGFVSKIRI